MRRKHNKKKQLNIVKKNANLLATEDQIHTMKK